MALNTPDRPFPILDVAGDAEFMGDILAPTGDFPFGGSVIVAFLAIVMCPLLMLPVLKGLS